MQSFKKALYRVLAYSGIRAPVRLLLELANRNLVPAVGPVPTAEKVLILAPHMDDETIGCGGAICAHVRAGAVVEVLFLTDGAQGFEPDVLSSHTSQQRSDIRKAESEKATALLGVSATHYLDLPDGKTKPSQEATQKLLAIIGQVRPDLVYLPFLTDSHHDHLITNKLFIAACRANPSLKAMLCACYEVWTPLHPNCVIDISLDIDTKMAALECYTSQLAMNDYLSSVRGLNAYRAIANRSEGYAEAFYVTTASDYLSLADHL